jgi:uncharacterized protein YfaP (DUF2135 family)
MVTPYRRVASSSPPDTFVSSSIALNLRVAPAKFRKHAQFVEGRSNVVIRAVPTRFKKQAQFIEGRSNVAIRAMTTKFKKQAQFVSNGLQLNVVAKGRK